MNIDVITPLAFLVLCLKAGLPLLLSLASLALHAQATLAVNVDGNVTTMLCMVALFILSPLLLIVYVYTWVCMSIMMFRLIPVALPSGVNADEWLSFTYKVVLSWSDDESSSRAEFAFFSQAKQPRGVPLQHRRWAYRYSHGTFAPNFLNDEGQDNGEYDRI